jgi:hypothetical protein
LRSPIATGIGANFESNLRWRRYRLSCWPARDAVAQQVKWLEGTEPSKLKAPPNACDCHHHIYDARYPVDPM